MLENVLVAEADSLTDIGTVVADIGKRKGSIVRPRPTSSLAPKGNEPGWGWLTG